MNSTRLREFIRAVRSCKTASEERALINRECASIRNHFKEATAVVRTRNMLKLLYVRLLGYPTEFGQLEVVNLLSQTDFSSKRIGYLALQIILDEHDEVLTLSENRMKSDLANNDSLVQAVALNAAANVASEDMVRDVFDEVIRLVTTSKPYIRKKACLVALRTVRKAPEYAEFFLEPLTNLFDESHTTSLLCSLDLVNECLQTEVGAAFLPQYRRLANVAARVLKRLVLSGRTTEQDVCGIADPFLQVKILEFMRLIGKDSPATSEALNDALAQVITNTDASKNVGCAVQYECVRTIDAIVSDNDLRVLAVNTISRFLSTTRDNNLLFVALQTLRDYTKSDLSTVQQHQTVILECLKDVDISIRRRALELTVSLITEANVRLLVPDLLTYLNLCTEEMREEVVQRISQIIEEKSPTDEWRVDISVKLLKLAKQHAPISFATRLIGVLSKQSREVQSHTVRILWDEVSIPFDAIHQSRRSFLILALWAIGEYVDYLLQELSDLAPEKVVLTLSEITANSTHRLVKQYVLTALMKVAARYPQAQPGVLATFETFSMNQDCELQQRACEYTNLLRFKDVAAFCFEPMPPISICKAEEVVQPVQIVSEEDMKKQAASTLDDLFGLAAAKPETDQRGDPTSLSSLQELPQMLVTGTETHFDGGANVKGVLSAPAAVTLPPRPAADPFSFDKNLTQHPAPPAPSSLDFVFQQPDFASPLIDSQDRTEVFSCPDFVAYMSAAARRENLLEAFIFLQSHLDASMNNLSFHVAAQKTCVLTLDPLTSTTILPRGQLVQRIEVDTSNQIKKTPHLTLRILLKYFVNETLREQLFQASKTL